MREDKKNGLGTTIGLVTLVAFAATAGYLFLGRVTTKPNGLDTSSELATVSGTITNNENMAGDDGPSFIYISQPHRNDLEVMYANINGWIIAGEQCDSHMNIYDFASKLKTGTKVVVRGRWQLDQAALAEHGIKKKRLTVCTAPDESITVEK